jgi:peptide chain release factor 2
MDTLSEKIKELETNIAKVGKILGIEKKKSQFRELNLLISEKDFWQDNEKAIKISQEAESLKSDIDRFEEIQEELEEIKDLLVLAEECADKSADNDIEKRLKGVDKKFSDLEFFLLFSEKNDKKNAIVSIHAGSGGVDAQDWAEILERMYLRFSEKKNFKVEVLDRNVAKEAGIKSSVLKISGAYAYGYLKSENGVHRLVRISPFDAEGMRHTSFAGVEVIPEIKDDVDFSINDQDLRIDVFKSSGPGGQSVNTTDSAVRILHIPSNISVSCQSERSQHQNKEKALDILRAKLYKLEEDKREERIKKIKGSSGQGTWGKQIRSYVFHPYQMVKDHRSDYSSSELDSVMGGDINSFIEAYLKLALKNKNQ